MTLTVTPGKAAKQALAQTLRGGPALAVSALLSYAAEGATPVSHNSSLSVRLKKAAKGRR
jgi:hypothetical protein